MMMIPTVYMSNRLEALYEQLRDNIFSEQTDPFAQRLIMVPSFSMQQWLNLRFAQDPHIGIAAGLSIQFLPQIIHHIAKAAQCPGFLMPNSMELTLRIIAEIQKIAVIPFTSTEQDDLWQPLINYVKITDGRITRKSEKRIYSISKKIAETFIKYGLYGKQLLENWPQTHWQAKLWEKIYSVDNWTYPQKWLEQFLLQKNVSKGLTIDIFAFSALPPIYFEFFHQLSEANRFRIYHLSPCKAFWGDICSNKERKWLRKKLEKTSFSRSSIEELENYLEDNHSLLANLGKLGKQFALNVEKYSWPIHEKYFISKASASFYDDYLDEDIHLYPEEQFSRLQAVQNDMLFLRNPINEPHSPFRQFDPSIQIHLVPTLLREIEVLYQNLIGVMDANHSILQNDILVMAPDITVYEPYIHALFNLEGKFKFHISDSSLPLKTALFEGFFLLTELSEKKWQKLDVLNLLKNPLIKQSQGFTDDNILTIEKWVIEANIQWGYSQETHENWIKKTYPHFSQVSQTELKTSWEAGLNRLIDSLIFANKSVDIDVSQAELLGRLSVFLKQAHDDLEELYSLSLSLNKWIEKLDKFFNFYFCSCESDPIVSAFFDKLQKASKSMPADEFNFFILLQIFKNELLSESHTFQGRENQAIRFSSLLPTRAIPAKVIYLIGMNEENFPRKEFDSSFNMLFEQKNSYYPTSSEHDRYLFLEAILSTRQQLFISYIGNSPIDQKPLNPSNLVSQFIAYLDRCYSTENEFSKQNIIVHPLHSFSPQYFTSESVFLKNYSERAYLKSLASNNTPSEVAAQPITIKAKENAAIYEHFSLTDLRKTILYPLKNYFHHELGIFLKEDEKESTEFILSALQKKIINTQLLAQHENTHLYMPETLSSGLFKEVASLQIQEQKNQILKFFKHFSILPEDIFKIALDRYPIKAASTTVSLLGSLENLCPQGMIILGENTFKTCIKLFPQLIIFHEFQFNQTESNRRISKNLLFTDTCESIELHFNHPERLWEDFLQYNALSRNTPCLLIPEWLESILNRDKDSLEKKIAQSMGNEFGKSYDTYLKWLFRSNKLPNAQQIIDDWAGWAERLFGELYRWYQ